MGQQRTLVCCILVGLALFIVTPASAQDDNESEPEAKPECVEHGLVFDDVVKSLEDDYQVKSMKPWVLKSVVIAECTTTPGQVPLTLTYWTNKAASRGLDLTYQAEITVPYDVEKEQTVKQEESLSQLRSRLGKSIREAERSSLLKDIKSAEPEMGAVLHTDGSIDYLVPAWGDDPAVKWNGKYVEWMSVPSSVEFSEPKLIGFKAAIPGLEEGKTCTLPDEYTVEIDPEARIWTFTFQEGKPCKGDWKVEMEFDGTVNSSRL